MCQCPVIVQFVQDGEEMLRAVCIRDSRTHSNGQDRVLSKGLCSDTYVWPPCRDETMFAEALKGTHGVDTAGVLTGIHTDAWFIALVNIYAAGARVVQTKSWVTLAHCAQIGSHTAPIGATALI